MFTCSLQACSYILRNDIIYHTRYEYVIVTPCTSNAISMNTKKKKKVNFLVHCFRVLNIIKYLRIYSFIRLGLEPN